MPFRCKQPAFITYSAHGGQSSYRQQPIKEHSFKYYRLLFPGVSSLQRDCNTSLVWGYWRYNSFSLLFAIKFCGIIFMRRLTVDEQFWFSFYQRNGCKRSLFPNLYLNNGVVPKSYQREVRARSTSDEFVSYANIADHFSDTNCDLLTVKRRDWTRHEHY